MCYLFSLKKTCFFQDCFFEPLFSFPFHQTCSNFQTSSKLFSNVYFFICITFDLPWLSLLLLFFEPWPFQLLIKNFLMFHFFWLLYHLMPLLALFASLIFFKPLISVIWFINLLSLCFCFFHMFFTLFTLFIFQFVCLTCFSHFFRICFLQLCYVFCCFF